MTLLAKAIVAAFATTLGMGPPAYGGVTPEPTPEDASTIWKAFDYQERTTGTQTSGAPARINDSPDEDYLSFGGFGCVTQDDGTDQCFGQPAVLPPNDPDDPELTIGQILTAIRRIEFPALKINIQPGGETLVNFDTIFYARPQPFRRSITLLDYDIDVVATPASYRWNHGDGTSHTTNGPGGAYPSKDVIYRYQKKAKGLRPSVDVTYRVRFRVDAGSWQDLGQSLTANGPAGQLEVREATAVLTSY